MLIDLPKTRKRSGRPLTDTQVCGVHNREALMNSQLIYSNNDSITDHSTGVKWTRKLDICWRECEWRVPEKTPRAHARVFGVFFLACCWCYVAAIVDVSIQNQLKRSHPQASMNLYSLDIANM